VNHGLAVEAPRSARAHDDAVVDCPEEPNADYGSDSKQRKSVRAGAGIKTPAFCPITSFERRPPRRSGVVAPSALRAFGSRGFASRRAQARIANSSRRRWRQVEGNLADAIGEPPENRQIDRGNRCRTCSSRSGTGAI
jgi:hypothetical protein